ncbi:C4-dicarboxylate ABC transporter [Synergistales bacterium]|nr:C4-dicarboxylate ABC transporter [Synergistales bacterium]
MALADFLDKLRSKDKIVDVDMAELEVESGNRLEQLPKWVKKIVALLALVWTIFQIYTGFFGLYPALIQRTATLNFGLVLCFICFKCKKSDREVKFYDWVLVLLSFSILAYIIVTFGTLIKRGGAPNNLDVFFGTTLILLVIEATRRCVGLPLVIVVLAFLLYAFAGPYMPSVIGHRGYGIGRVSSQMFLTGEGIFGTPMAVMTTFVFAFVLFGCFLEATGGAKLFIDLAFAITGRFAGGPAKTAVVASGLLGTISGSSLANVVTTGSFTIPLMKKCGYRGSFAGGVEASASSAGQIMPPVMGAAAFIMAEMTGISYLEICVAATIPAILYYISVFLSVDLEARRTHLKTVPKDEVPPLWGTLKRCIPLLFPIVTLIALLVVGYTPLKAALYATAIMVVSSFFGKETMLTWRGFYEALTKSAHNSVSVCVACAVCGIVTGVITLTGLGLKLSDLILRASGGDMLNTLLLTMVASIILGMGLPTTAKYIVLAAIAAPAIVKLGVPVVGAHLFILYFGVIAEVTPPVALTSYAGAAIAKAPGVETALQGLKISIGAFFIPFMFCYYPSLLLLDTTLTGMIMGLFSSFVGVICLSAASIGYFFGSLTIWQRLLMFFGTAMVIHPALATDVIGAAIILATVVFQKYRCSKNNPMRR